MYNKIPYNFVFVEPKVLFTNVQSTSVSMRRGYRPPPAWIDIEQEPSDIDRNKGKRGRNITLIIFGSIVIIYIFIDQFIKERVPVFGRKRLLLIPVNVEKKLGEDEFEKIKMAYPVLAPYHDYSILLQRIGKRIRSVANTDLGFEWEFVVLDEPLVNAFCLPGGKVVFFKGLMDLFCIAGIDRFGYMDINAVESMIASVMAHEIAHALLRHSAEQMTIMAKTAILLSIIRFIVGGPIPGDTLIMNLGVLLPYSRRHEHEADLIGLYLMSRACYNPKYALAAFNLLSKINQEDRLMVYVSTHPTFEDRIELFKNHLDNALKERAKFCYTSPDALYRDEGKKRTVNYWWEDLDINLEKDL